MRIIIIGAGVVGYTIAKKLSGEAQDVVVIEKDERRIKEVKETLDVKVIHGSGSSPKILREAGIEHADMVIAVTDSDEVNMVACLIAGTQSRVPKKIARIRDPEYIGYTRIFEKDYLDLDFNINPGKVAADRILRIVDVPGAVDVVEFAEGKVKLLGFRLSVTSGVVGKRLKDLKDLHPDHKVIIVAIYRGGDTIIPKGSTTLQPGDLVFVVTIPSEIPNLLRLLGREEMVGNRMMIVGGGGIGFYLAQRLEERDFLVKVIERDEKRCGFIAEGLKKAIVLHGDGTNHDLLREEGIEDIDTFIAVTNNEETNVLTSLMARKMGAARCIPLIDKPEYISMASAIGLDVIVSPRLASVGSILQFVRPGKILTVTTLIEERVEAIESIAMETSEIAGRPLREIKFPQGAIIGAIVRGEDVIVPEGDAIILPGDKVVIFALAKAVPKVEKFLMVKMEYF